MEEKETLTPNEEANKLTYEQLEQAALQLQQRVILLEHRLKTIDAVSMRIAWMFQVLENKESFSSEFTDKCAKEVESLLTLEKEDSNTEIKKV